MKTVLTAAVLTLSMVVSAAAEYRLEAMAAILFPNDRATVQSDDPNTIILESTADGRTLRRALTAEDACNFVVRLPGRGEFTTSQEIHVVRYDLRHFIEIHDPFGGKAPTRQLRGVERCTRIDVLGRPTRKETCSSPVFVWPRAPIGAWQAEIEGVVRECKRSPKPPYGAIYLLTHPETQQPPSGRSLIENLQLLTGEPKN